MKHEFRYHKELGIIDWFFGTLTKDELIKAYKEDFEASGLSAFVKEMDEKELGIISTIQAEENEAPHTIRYFVIPDFSGFIMEVSAVAKISNNGSTYLFTDNEQLMDMYINP